ncbi:MAG: type II secretion system F family protein [Granulosicoccus sp.]
MTLFVVSLAFGGFIALLVWQIYRVFNEVPNEDRQFLDRPALGFRLTWPLILLLEHHFDHLYGEQQIHVVLLRLKRAGVEYSISPQQFIAGKIVSAVFFALFSLVFVSVLGREYALIAVLVSVGGYYYPELWLRELSDVRRGSILRTLPFYLDIITLSVEAGSNLTGGLTQAVQKSTDSPLRREFSRVLRDIRAGKTRADSLREMAERTGSQPVSNVVTGLIQAERTGSSLGPLLRAQAEQLRSERFQRAEKKAMEAPVKLLGPLVMFIFPTTFFVLGFLVTSKGLQEGIISWAPLVWAYTWPGK